MSIDHDTPSQSSGATSETKKAEQPSRRPLGRRRSSLFARGEPMVWLTGGSLAVCLAMALGLIVLVVWQGGRAFWPKDLVEIETRSGTTYMGEASQEEAYTPDPSVVQQVNDEFVSRMARAWTPLQFFSSSVSTSDADTPTTWDALVNEPAIRLANSLRNNNGKLHRTQLRTGNYDLGSAHYTWIDGLSERTRSLPVWGVVVERLEWGRFYGTPKAFLRATNPPSESIDPDPSSLVFERVAEGEPSKVWALFEEAHEEIRARHKHAREMEHEQVGALNDQLRDVRLERRRAERDHGTSSPEARQQLIHFMRVKHDTEGEDVREGYSPMYERLAAVDAMLAPTDEARDAGAHGHTLALWERLKARALNTQDANELDPRESAASLRHLPGELDQIKRDIAKLDLENAKSRIVFETADGQEKTMALAEIVRAYAPNQLGWTDKVGVYTSRWGEFLTADPREANSEGGVWPALFGTIVMTLIMSLLVVPFGVLAALYLREYAKQGVLVSAVRVAVNNLAGVPSIVFGVFGLGFFCYIMGAQIDELFFSLELNELSTPTYGKGGLLWASLTLALLTLPVVVVATEEALAAVPNSMREGSFACGASKWQTIRRITLPRAMPGIMTGMILAIARGAGEVAPLMLVGAVKLAPNLPIDGTAPYVHPERSFMHLGFHIYDLGFQSSNSEAARPMVYTTTMLLIGIVVLLNVAAIMIRSRLRRAHG